MKALISIIIPVYNAEKYLVKCINSILYQTYQNYEILLIDDGSTDDSGIICDEYVKKDTRIKVYHIQNNGVSNARNVGLTKAKGEYIAFVDSDDFIENTYLEKLYKSISEQKSDIVFCKKNICEKDKIIKSEETALVETNDLRFNNFIKKFFILNTNSNEIIMGVIWRILFKKSIIDKYNLCFNVELTYCEDMCFLFDYLLKINKISVVDEPLYNYVVHNDSSVNTVLSNNIVKYEKFYNCVKEKFDDDFLKKQIQYQLIYLNIMQYMNLKQWDKNVKQIYKSSLYNGFTLAVLINSSKKSLKMFIVHLFTKTHSLRLLKILISFIKNKKW